MPMTVPPSISDLARLGFVSPPSPNTAIMGNSRDANCANYPNGAAVTGNILRGGYAAWAECLSFRSLRIPVTSIFGYPSRTVGEFFALARARVEALSPRPAVLIVGDAANNIVRTNGEQTFEAITGTGAYASTPIDVGTSLVTISSGGTVDVGTTLRPGYTHIFAWARALGMRVIVRPVGPRSDTVLTAAQVATSLRVNRWLAEAGSRDQGVYVLDYVRDQADPASTLFAPRAGIMFDGLHENGLGDFYIGKSIARLLDRLPFARPDLLAVNNAPYSLADAPYGNLATNAQMQGTGGSLGSGVTGSVATSWTAQKGGTDTGMTVTASIAASGAFPHLSMQQIALGGTYTSAGLTGTPPAPDLTRYARLTNNLSQASFAQAAPLDVVEAHCFVEADANPTNLGSVALQIRDAGNVSYNYGMYPARGGALPPEAWSGILYTDPWTVPAGTGAIVVPYAFAKGDVAGSGLPLGGTVRFGRVTVRKVAPPT